MNWKWSLLGVGRFYTAEEAWTFLMNLSDFEDEATSESEIEGDSSDSSEYTPEQQYQVRTDSDIPVASPPKVSKAKEIPKNGQKAAPKLVARKRVIPQKASALHHGEAMASNSDLDVEDYYHTI